MHTDEAVNAYLVGQALEGKGFQYDPTDRHGPSLVAFAVPLVKAQGARTFAELTEADVRMTAVAAGTATLLLFGAAVEIFGFVPCLLAAALTAVCPLPVYYDRYFIHESILVAASCAFLVSGWKAWTRQSRVQAMLAGAAAGLMLASKETAVLNFAATGIAAIGLWMTSPSSRGRLRGEHLKLAAVFGCSAVVVAIAFYTWGGHEWRMLPVLRHAVPGMAARARGQGHQQAVWYYARLMSGGWSGGALCGLGLIGLYFAWASKRAEGRLLAMYAVALGAIYSLIPYKTPWLALNLWVPLALLASIAMERTLNYAMSLRWLLATAGVAGIALALGIAHDTRERVFLHPADEDNPYAYAHTSDDILDLPAALDRLCRERCVVSPRIAVIAQDPWPLPWYLRRYSETGYWQPGQDPGPADFYITTTEAAQMNEERLRGWRAEFFGVRPNVLILVWSRP